MSASDLPEHPSMPEFWSVQVNAGERQLVSIGHNWLSSDRALTDEDVQTIIGAARHLLSFVGYGLPPCKFDPDEDEDGDKRAREALEAAARAVEQHDMTGREWVPGSLWDTLSKEAAARIRALASALTPGDKT